MLSRATRSSRSSGPLHPSWQRSHSAVWLPRHPNQIVLGRSLAQHACLRVHVPATYSLSAQSGTDLALIPLWNAAPRNGPLRVKGLVWGDQCQGRSWIIPSPCSTYQRPSPRPDWLCWAAGRSDGQGWPKAIAKRLALDGHEQGGSLVGSGEAECPNGTSFLRPVFLPQFSVRKHDDRGEFAIWRAPRATNLYSVDPCGSAP